MKNILFVTFAAVVLLTATGCPVGMDTSPGTPGTEKIDKFLLGTWKCNDSEASILKVKMEQAKDNALTITVLERGEMYALETDNLTGWVTEVEGIKLIYAKPENEEKFYTMSYDEEGGNLVTYDVSLKVGGVDACTSTQEFREEIKASMKYEDFLSDKHVYSKE